MSKINKLFKEHLFWKYDDDSTYFLTKSYDKNICKLRMNDFPDEPLWTLFFEDEEIDFDDEPKIWRIDSGSLLK